MSVVVNTPALAITPADPAAAPIGLGPSISLADDMLNGVAEIALFLYGEADEKAKQRIYHLASRKVAAGRRLPTWRFGTTICARRTTILKWISAQEAASIVDAEAAE